MAASGETIVSLAQREISVPAPESPIKKKKGKPKAQKKTGPATPAAVKIKTEDQAGSTKKGRRPGAVKWTEEEKSRAASAHAHTTTNCNGTDMSSEAFNQRVCDRFHETDPNEVKVIRTPTALASEIAKMQRKLGAWGNARTQLEARWLLETGGDKKTEEEKDEETLTLYRDIYGKSNARFERVYKEIYHLLGTLPKFMGAEKTTKRVEHEPTGATGTKATEALERPTGAGAQKTLEALEKCRQSRFAALAEADEKRHADLMGILTRFQVQQSQPLAAAASSAQDFEVMKVDPNAYTNPVQREYFELAQQEILEHMRERLRLKKLNSQSADLDTLQPVAEEGKTLPPAAAAQSST